MTASAPLRNDESNFQIYPDALSGEASTNIYYSSTSFMRNATWSVPFSDPPRTIPTIETEDDFSDSQPEMLVENRRASGFWEVDSALWPLFNRGASDDENGWDSGYYTGDSVHDSDHELDQSMESDHDSGKEDISGSVLDLSSLLLEFAKKPETPKKSRILTWTRWNSPISFEMEVGEDEESMFFQES